MSLRNFAWRVAMLALVVAAGCGPADDPAGLSNTEPIDDPAPLPQDGPESTTPVPGVMSAANVFETPTTPSCCTVTGGPYGRFGFLLHELSDGFHPLSSAAGVGSCNNPPEDPNNGITLTRQAHAVDWTSTMPVGAVIVGSALGARVYVYAPRSWGDAGLRSPIDPSTGNPAEITSLEICYDYALRVGVEVEPILTRSVQWGLSETVTPAAWELFAGDRAHSRIDIAVAPTGSVDSPPTVLGTLTIENMTPLPATVSSITNVISVGIVVPVDCAGTFPFVLAPGETRVCTYRRELANTNPRTNTVSVNTTSTVRGGSGSASIVFGARTVENGTVHVTAPDGSTHGPFDAAAAFSLDRTLEVSMLDDDTERSFAQRATIVETKQSIERSIQLRRVDPGLTQQLSSSYERNWHWSLERSLEQTEIILGSGQSMNIDGAVSLAAAPELKNFRSVGTVTLSNPHSTRSLLVTELSTLSAADIALVATIPQEIPAQSSVTLNLSLQFHSADVQSSVLSLAYRNVELWPDGTSTPTESSFVEETASLQFDQLAAEVDRCVEVHDALAGLSSIHCAETTPADIAASIEVGPYSGCGTFDVNGMAEAIGMDSGSQSQSEYRVDVVVACESGCTRGTGYWKSHAPAGPPPYDSTWELLPERGETQLFDSGMSYVEVLWASPRSSPWLKLAISWVAARLNQLAGADASAIADAFAEGESMLHGHSPQGPFSETDAARMQQLADTIERWNAGEIGPGSCPPLPSQ